MNSKYTESSNLNIVDCLRKYSKTQPEHPAMEDGERVITYRELNLRTDEAAVTICAAGISVGDIVTVILDNSIEHLIVICGLARAGAVIFSLNPMLTKSEIQNCMAEVGSKTLISHTDEFDFPAFNTISMEQICTANGESFGDPRASGDQPLVLIQSSGTTGKPKSILFTHSETMKQYVVAAENHGFSQTDRYLSLISMCFHACRGYYFFLLNRGATLLLSNHHSMSSFIGFVNDKDVSYLYLTPNYLFELLDYPTNGGMLFPKLRALTSGSAPISHEQRLQARKDLTPNFCEAYGSNELGSVAYSKPIDQDKYPGSVGRLNDLIDVEVVDGNDVEVPYGNAGLVRFCYDGMAKGYVDNPKMTARHFRNGWFYPGDVARINGEGYLYLLGRADDVINNAGVKFYPIEVENVLLSHPAVREAAVFPLPHKLAGQIAGAAVVVEGEVTYDQLKEYCGERLAAYKIPNFITFGKVLPRNAMGKVVKRKLVADMQAQLQVQSEGSNDDQP